MKEKMLIDDAVQYLSASFFIVLRIIDEVSEYLPFQIKGKSFAYIANIEETKFLVVVSEKESVLSANNFLYIKRLREKFSLPVILVSRDISENSRKYAFLNQIGLIVPFKFSYLPSLFIHREVNEIVDKPTYVDTEKEYGVIPSYLLAYYLSGMFSNGFNSNDIISLLGVSKMAVSRATKELLTHGFIVDEFIGRGRRYFFSKKRKEVWSHYKDRITPLSTGFVTVSMSKLRSSDVFYSGESALSKYTFISSPLVGQYGVCMSGNDRYMRPITPATIDGDYFFKILNLLHSDVNSNDLVQLQIFPYKPMLNDGFLNKVFLLLSRFNKNDVRVKSSFLELETEVFNELADF
ncbi:hypothetical protein ACWKX9_26055 [Enterobacter asburiae]